MEHILPSKLCVLAAIFIVGIGTLSTVVPLFLLPPGRISTGMYGYSDDYVGYVSYIKEGMYGRNTMLIRSLPTRQPASPVHFFYIAIGKTIGRVTGSAVLAYHITRIILAFLFVFAVQKLFRSIQSSDRLAVLTTIVAFLSGSLGWFWHENGEWVYKGLTYFPFSLITSERVVDQPHYLAGAILFIVCFVLLRAKEHTAYQGAKIAVVSIILSVVHTAFSILLSGISAVVIGIHIVKIRFRFIPSVIHPMIVILVSAIGIGVMYYFLSLYENADKIWFNVFSYRETVSVGSVVRDFLSFGPTFWIGLPGLIWASKRSKSVISAESLILIWFVVQMSLFSIFYQFFSADRVRFIQSLYFIPFAYGSVFFLLNVLSRWKEKALWSVIALIIISLPTFIHDERNSLNEVKNPKNYSILEFPTSEQISAYRFLDMNTPIESTVLAWFESSNHILLYSHNRVIGNTQGWTPQEGEAMKADRDAFYSGSLSPASARLLLEKYTIDFVYEGYQERALGNIRTYSFLEKVYENSESVIYKVI